MSFNKITIVGNLGKDPELRYTPQGKAVCNFSMATNEKRPSKDGLVELVTWFKITLWGVQAENAAKYLKKGSPVYIEGRLSVNTWVNKEGQNQTTLEVNGSDMQFIGGGGQSTAKPQSTEKAEEYSGPEDEDQSQVSSRDAAKGVMPAESDDDIPF